MSLERKKSLHIEGWLLDKYVVFHVGVEIERLTWWPIEPELSFYTKVYLRKIAKRLEISLLLCTFKDLKQLSPLKQILNSKETRRFNNVQNKTSLRSAFCIFTQMSEYKTSRRWLFWVIATANTNTTWVCFGWLQQRMKPWSEHKVIKGTKNLCEVSDDENHFGTQSVVHKPSWTYPTMPKKRIKRDWFASEIKKNVRQNSALMSTTVCYWYKGRGSRTWQVTLLWSEQEFM